MEYLDKYDALVSLLTEEVEIDGKKVSLKDDFEKFSNLENIPQSLKKDFKSLERL